MCLVSDSKTPSISTNDIQCYKILIPVGGKLLTPYRDFSFPIGVVVVDEVPTPELDEIFGVFMVEGGYFHSYSNLETAKFHLGTIEWKYKKTRRGVTPKIYKAEIPANTQFYNGRAGDLCSKSLKIIEECVD